MHFTKNTVLLLAGALSASAVPMEGGSDRLTTRDLKWQSNCDKPNPGKSGETMKQRAERAFGDVAEMAKTALEKQDGKGNSFADSKAYARYFGEDDADKVKKMMEVVAKAADDIDIEIYCGSESSEECKGNSALAATWPKKDKSSMRLCDRFFTNTAPQTKNDFASKQFEGRRGTWCSNPDGKFLDFEVAGLTLFHELTHLHAIGEKAGLPEKKDIDLSTEEEFETSGTIDIYVRGSEEDMEKYNGKEPWQAARELRKLWKEYNDSEGGEDEEMDDDDPINDPDFEEEEEAAEENSDESMGDPSDTSDDIMQEAEDLVNDVIPDVITDPASILPGGGDPPAARMVKRDYKPFAPSTENAESYAASALEFYYLHKCKWEDIVKE